MKGLGEVMSNQEHIEFHKYLHKNLDILLADWIRHTGKLPSESTVMELLDWAYKQTLEPTEVPK